MSAKMKSKLWKHSTMVMQGIGM